MTVDAFIDRWEASGASEEGNAKPFLMQLCAVLDIPRARRSDVQALLETLAALGPMEETEEGAYAT